MTKSCLAISDFSANIGKTKRHIDPLAETATVTVICITSGKQKEGVTYQTVPSLGLRPVGLLLMFALGLFYGATRRYDAVVSFSLFPHGCFALVIGRLCGLPAHLGILGSDLETHAQAWYGELVRLLVPLFDVVSVPGTAHRQQVIDFGVDPERVATLTNPVDTKRYRPQEEEEEGGEKYAYDFIWVGRFQPVKRPLLFVRALGRLRKQGVEFRAVMVGDGPLSEAVEIAAERNGVADALDLPGWVENPLDYYHRAKVFALTSRRDALPLTLIEALSTGHACVVPDVGNVTDASIDGRNSIVLDPMTADSLATALRRLVEDTDLYERLADDATDVRHQFSYEAATADWEYMLTVLDGGAIEES